MTELKAVIDSNCRVKLSIYSCCALRREDFASRNLKGLAFYGVIGGVEFCITSSFFWDIFVHRNWRKEEDVVSCGDF